MQQNTRFFGLTPTQLGILAGLAGTACLLFGLVGWFALQGSLNRLPDDPQSAPNTQFTATPWMLPTPAPTQTSTPIPYETLVPEGWSQFKTGLVEIWLPAQFQSGDPQLLNNSSNKAIGELILTDSPLESTLSQKLVLVSYEPLSAESLDAYLDSQVAKLPGDLRVAERRKVTINSREVVRFVFERRLQNAEVNHLMYVFLDGTTIWYVEYIAPLNEFYEMLSLFEKSVKTFRMVR